MNNRWLKYFMSEAALAASMSKDDNAQVGAVIFNPEENIEITKGWNDLARGVEHKPERNSRPDKYEWTAHAELNAITNAAREGRSTKGMALVVTFFPCNHCAIAIINAGIKQIYSPEPDFEHHKYGNSHTTSLQMFEEAGVKLVYI